MSHRLDVSHGIHISITSRTRGTTAQGTSPLISNTPEPNGKHSHMRPDFKKSIHQKWHDTLLYVRHYVQKKKHTVKKKETLDDLTEATVQKLEKNLCAWESSFLHL